MIDGGLFRGRRWHARSAAEQARYRSWNADVFANFDDALHLMATERPKYCTVLIVGMLSNELPQFAARMNACHALGYGIQRSPTEQWGEPTTGLLLARRD